MTHTPNKQKSVDELLKENKELRERRDYYRGIVESADKGIWVINGDNKTVYVNYRMAEMLGTTADGMMGKTILTYLDEEDRNAFTGLLERCGSGCQGQFDLRFRRADGRELWALAGIAPFFDLQGSRIGVSGTFADITERKLMEAELRETRDHLVKAQHVGRMGSWVRDLGTNMVEASGEIGEILGIKIEPATVEDVAKLLYSPEERERILRISNAAIEGGGSYMTDVRMTRPDGREIYCHLEAEVVKDRSGRPVKVVGVLQDITERKKGEIALEAARAQAEFFIDLIGHDIGNLNQAVLGYLELALERLAPPGKDRELLTQPIEVIRESSMLISDVRMFRKVVSGELSHARTDVGKALYEAIADVSREAGRGARVNFMPKGECHVMANELLKDAFANIIKGSIISSRDTPVIDITMSEVCEEGHRKCRIDFTDRGPGIQDVKEKLLAGVREAPEKSGRRGLGMQFVKALVSAYQGRFWVEDRVQGDRSGGVRLVILLPLADP